MTNKVQFLFNESIEIPNEWKIEYLKNLCIEKAQYGAAVEAIDKDEKLPRYVRITDISKDGELREDKWASITKENSEPYILSENEILFARTGATVGKTYRYRNKDGNCAFAGYLIRFKPNPKKCDIDFLYHYTLSHNYHRWLLSEITQGAQPNVNAEQYSNMMIILPTIDEQKKIGKILSNLDMLIQNKQKIIEQMQELKQGQMQKLLTRGLKKQNTKLVEGLFQQKERIPEDWDCVNLEKLSPKDKSSIRMGPFGSDLKKEELVETGIMTLWIENIVNNEFSWEHKKYITNEKFQELKGFQVIPDDVLMTMMGTVGKVAITPKNIGTAIITSHLLKITLNQKKCLPRYLYYFLQSNFVYRQIIQESRGVVMSGLNTKIIKALLIKVPSIGEQGMISSILFNLDSQINQEIQYKENLEKIKKGLMQQFLTGEKRVIV
jgi:type I restriction enzyme, S subunit